MDKVFYKIANIYLDQLNVHKPILYPSVGNFTSDSVLDKGERLASRAPFLFDDNLNLHNIYWQQSSLSLSYNTLRLSNIVQSDVDKLLERCTDDETYTLIHTISTDYLEKEKFNLLRQHMERSEEEGFGLDGATIVKAEYLKAEALLMMTSRKQTSYVYYIEFKLNGTETKYQLIYVVNSDVSFEVEYKSNMLAYVISNKMNGRKPTAYESDILEYISGNKIRYEVRAEKDARALLKELKREAKQKTIQKILELGQYIKTDYTDKIGDLEDNIESMENDIRDAYKLILEYQTILKSEWLGNAQSATQELYQYLIDHPHLQDHIIKIDYDRDVVQRKIMLTLGLKAPLDFNGDLYLRYRNKNNDNVISELYEHYHQLMLDIMNNTIKIYFSGKAIVDLATGKLKVSGMSKHDLHGGAINNTHWLRASCPGTLRNPVKSAVRNKHFIPMLHLLIQGVAGLNMDDLVVTKRFIRDLKAHKFDEAEVHKSDGTIVLLGDYVQEIRDEKEVPF